MVAPSGPRVVLYTTSVATSPNVRSAIARMKLILDANKIEYEEVDLIMSPGRRAAMLEGSGGIKTLPQLHVDDKYLGDMDMVQSMEDCQELAPLLKPPAGPSCKEPPAEEPPMISQLQAHGIGSVKARPALTLPLEADPVTVEPTEAGLVPS